MAMTKRERRDRIEQLKRERALLTNVFDRIAFDNAPGTNTDEHMCRLVASLESGR